MHISLQLADSSALADSLIANRIDSLITIVNKLNENGNKNDIILHDLDDIRQETNNIINKQNGWFSFWVAILALVGALIPSILFFRDQQRMHSTIGKVDSAIKDNNNKVESAIGKVDSAIKEIESKKLSAEIQNLSQSLMACLDNRNGINNNTDRMVVWNDYFDKICGKTKKYFDLYSGQEDIEIKNVLLQLFNAYNACVILTTTRYKSGQLQVLITNIGSVIRNLYKDKKEDINSDLDKILEQMNKFRL